MSDAPAETEAPPVEHAEPASPQPDHTSHEGDPPPPPPLPSKDEALVLLMSDLVAALAFVAGAVPGGQGLTPTANRLRSSLDVLKWSLGLAEPPPQEAPAEGETVRAAPAAGDVLMALLSDLVFGFAYISDAVPSAAGLQSQLRRMRYSFGVYQEVMHPPSEASPAAG